MMLPKNAEDPTLYPEIIVAMANTIGATTFVDHPLQCRLKRLSPGYLKVGLIPLSWILFISVLLRYMVSMTSVSENMEASQFGDTAQRYLTISLCQPLSMERYSVFTEG